ncbi:MAG: cyanophycinase [Fimbriimonadaceae bacterium]
MGVVDPQSGRLYLAGGGTTSTELANSFIQDCGGPSSLILVMSQTRVEPERGSSSVDFLKENGAKNVVLIGVADPKESDRKSVSDYLKKTRGIWIPGGDQKLFPKRWGVEWLRTEFTEALSRGVNFFGTSAGSMIMSDPMIAGPGSEADTVEFAPGIGLFPGLIDTHFVARGRKKRFEDGLRQRKSQIGVGLDEGEWIVYQDKAIIRIIGKPLILGVPLKLNGNSRLLE